MPIAYLNGRYLPLEQASVSAMDRGFLFGDGVYEVIPIWGNRTFREKEHLDRLARNLQAIYLKMDTEIFPSIIEGLLERNVQLPEQAIYLQVTRGVSPVRDQALPIAIMPTIFAYCLVLDFDKLKMERGVAIITVEDIRWQRCDIKSINLLPNILMQHLAKERAASEALFVRNGQVLEGTASNFFIVEAGEVYTPPLGKWLLGGITRKLVLELARQEGIACHERNIFLSELSSADEIWLTSSTKEILPVTRLNGKPVGSGEVGPLWRRMLMSYHSFKQKMID